MQNPTSFEIGGEKHAKTVKRIQQQIYGLGDLFGMHGNQIERLRLVGDLGFNGTTCIRIHRPWRNKDITKRLA